LAADGLSQRELARRLGINRRTVARMLASEGPPRYRRVRTGSQLDRFEPVLRRLVEEWPQIKAPRATELLREYGYAGSVDLVRRRLRELRPRALVARVSGVWTSHPVDFGTSRRSGAEIDVNDDGALQERVRRSLRGSPTRDSVIIEQCPSTRQVSRER